MSFLANICRSSCEKTRTLLDKINLCKSRQQEILGHASNTCSTICDTTKAEVRILDLDMVEKAVGSLDINGSQLAIAAKDSIV
jgi:hypothetical protein